MKLHEKSVSVIVPVYNVQKYLNKCIESVIQQSYENIEIILVDDKSSDDSGELCDRLALGDKRITVIHKKKNEGLNMARKTGLDISHGEYVTFLDSDDFLAPNAIELSLATLINTDADISIFASREFSDDNQLNETLVSNDTVSKTVVFDKKDQIFSYALFGDGNLPGVQYITAWGKLYARGVLTEIDWQSSNYRLYEDNFWTPQVLLRAERIAVHSEPLINYRRNVPYGASGSNLGNRMTGNSIDMEPVGYLELIERLRGFYKSLARSQGFSKTFDSRIDEQALLSSAWRIDNLARAGILNSENNMKYVTDGLQDYINSKNKHIDNLTDKINQLNVHSENLARDLRKSEEELTLARNRLTEITNRLREFEGVKRSVRLLAGNMKRKITKRKH